MGLEREPMSKQDAREREVVALETLADSSKQIALQLNRIATAIERQTQVGITGLRDMMGHMDDMFEAGAAVAAGKKRVRRKKTVA